MQKNAPVASPFGYGFSRAKLFSSKENGGLMKEKSIWEEFFDAHAPIYEDNIFTMDEIEIMIVACKNLNDCK